MNKKEYLFKALSRTNRKDQENFVINAIWNKIANNELIPVSQQYVNCGDTWYLIDLFFPQINLGIEVDEAGHLNNIEADNLRSDQIITALRYNNNADFELLRIKTHVRYEEMQSEIDSVVLKINNKISLLSQPLKWETEEEKIKKIRLNKKLSIFDNISFSSIKQALNELFDWGRISSGGPSKVYFKYKHDTTKHLWFAYRNLWKNGKEIGQSGYINRLSNDGKQIIEFKNEASEVLLNEKDLIQDDILNKDIRITFLKYKTNLGENGYKFVGLFHCTGMVITEFNGKKIKAKKYDRLTDYIDLP